MEVQPATRSLMSAPTPANPMTQSQSQQQSTQMPNSGGTAQPTLLGPTNADASGVFVKRPEHVGRVTASEYTAISFIF